MGLRMSNSRPAEDDSTRSMLLVKTLLSLRPKLVNAIF